MKDMIRQPECPSARDTGRASGAWTGRETGDILGCADTGMDETESFLHQLYDDSEGDRVHVSHCSNHTYALPDKKDYHAGKVWKTCFVYKKSI